MEFLRFRYEISFNLEPTMKVFRVKISQCRPITRPTVITEDDAHNKGKETKTEKKRHKNPTRP